MPPRHHIRNGQAADANRLAVLATQVWLHTYATDGINEVGAQYVLAEFTPEKYRQALADAATHVLVAERDGHLLGLAVVACQAPCPTGASAVAELRTLYVQAHFLGQGIGRALLQAAEAQARAHAGSALWLKVNARNASAQAFYARQGYAQVGTTWFVLGEGRHENHVLLGPGA